MKKRPSLIALFLISILLIVGITTIFELFGAQDNVEKAVRIERGDNAATIGKKLAEAGIIKNATNFRLIAKLRDADRNLKPGTYVFTGRNNLWKAITELSEGKTESIRITFPEGWSMDRTLKRIEESGLADYNTLYSAATDTALVRHLTGFPLSSLEGFLYPETYFFPVYASADSLLAIMTKQFFKVLRQNDIDLREEQDFYKTLILASIVQKEAGNNDESATIAGVFARRLRLGMPLQSCPTVDYILEKRGIRREVLTIKDTQIDNPYNTYVYPGLPPTPIANPHINAILAALNPIDRGFLYFFADNKGNNVFSATFEEHQNKQRNMRHAR
ncbi:MAG: endolytic transglycosylase MltG [Candidatus Cloacimonadaceae bacterium]